MDDGSRRDDLGQLQPDGTLLVDLNGCARCHGDGHPGLAFALLTHQMEVGGMALTHWALCPTTGEPILMLITS